MNRIIRKLIVYVTTATILIGSFADFQGLAFADDDPISDVYSSLAEEDTNYYDSEIESMYSQAKSEEQSAESTALSEPPPLRPEISREEMLAEIEERRQKSEEIVEMREAEIAAHATAASSPAPRANAEPADSNNKYPVAPFDFDSEAQENISINTGTLYYKEKGVVLPGKNGLDLVIGVRYDSSKAQDVRMDQIERPDFEDGMRIQSGTLFNRLGLGWEFQFPSMTYIDDQIYFTLADGRTYLFDEEFLGQLSGNATASVSAYADKNREFTYDGRSSEYYLEYMDGRKDYFTSYGLLIGMVDRFGNAIKFSYGSDNGEETVDIIDTYNEWVQFRRSRNGETITVILPHNRKITYYTGHWLFAKEDEDGYWTTYDHEYVEHMYKKSRPSPSASNNRLELMSDFYNAIMAQSMLNTANWYFNSNLTGINYPSGLRTEYEYLTEQRAHRHNNNSNYNHDLKVSTHYATLGQDGYQGIAAISSRRDIDAWRGENMNVRNYMYGDENRDYSSMNYSGPLGERGYGTGNLPSWHNYYTMINDVSNRIYYRYYFNRNHSKTKETRTVRGTSEPYYIEKVDGYHTFYNIGKGVYSALPKKVTITENGATTIETFEYNNLGQMTKYNPIQGNTSNQITMSYGFYGLWLEKTYLKEAGMTIREKNTIAGGNVTKYELFENGVLKKRTDYGYNSDGRLAWQRDYIDANKYVQTSYSCYPYRRDISVTKGGLTEKYEYDAYGRLTKYTSGGSYTLSNSYGNENGKMHQKTTNSRGTTTTYYDKYNNIINAYDELGNRTEYVYTSFGKIFSVFAYKKDNTQEHIHTYAYLNNMKLFEEVNGNNVYTHYEYDPQGRLSYKSILRGDEASNYIYAESYSYSSSGTDGGVVNKVYKTISGDTDAPTVKTVSYYDRLGRLTREGFFNGTTEETNANTYTYNFLGGVVTYKSALDQSKNLSYTKKFTVDFEGKTLTETNQESVVSTEYDMLGRRISATDAMGRKSVFAYDDRDRLISESIPFEGSYFTTRTYTYDYDDNRMEEMVTNNKPGSLKSESYTRFTYIYGKQLYAIHIWDGSNIHVTSQIFSYDAAGNMIKSYNVHGSTPISTTYTYDHRNRLASATDPLGQTEYYTYDNNSNISTFKDRNGITLEYAYSRLDQPLFIMVRNPDGNFGTGHKAFYYTRSGQLLEQSNGVQNAKYSYDNHGRMKTEQVNGVLKSYTYNAGDQRTGFIMSKDNTAQLNLGYTYDNLGRLSSVSNNGTVVANYPAYDKNHNLLTAYYPVAGITTSYTYGEANQLKSLVNKKGNSTLSSYSYTYYLDGNPESKTEGSVRTNYTYYGYGALKSESTPTETKAYTYDKHLNRKTMTVTGVENYTVNYEYDNNKRLTQEKKVKGNTTELDSYYYDKNGNQISKIHETVKPASSESPGLNIGLMGASANPNIQSEIMTYDAYNRLKTVNSSMGETAYTYQADDLRDSKTVNGVKTVHIWDGQNMVGELNSSGAFIGKYVRGAGLISRIDSSNAAQYYLYNGHGDVTGLTNASGTVTKTYAYDAFGSEVNKVAADTNPFRYSGEYFDNETGNIYLRARYYAPGKGRFTSEDPVRDGLNWYNYCENNPLMYADSNGMKPYSVSVNGAKGQFGLYVSPQWLDFIESEIGMIPGIGWAFSAGNWAAQRLNGFRKTDYDVTEPLGLASGIGEYVVSNQIVKTVSKWAGKALDGVEFTKYLLDWGYKNNYKIEEAVYNQFSRDVWVSSTRDAVDKKYEFAMRSMTSWILEGKVEVRKAIDVFGANAFSSSKTGGFMSTYQYDPLIGKKRIFWQDDYYFFALDDSLEEIITRCEGIITNPERRW